MMKRWVCLWAMVGVLSAAVHADLVHRWTLDETSGTVAADSVGTLNGTIIGGNLSFGLPGKLGTAIGFPGQNNNGIDTGSTSSLPATGPFSLFAYIKTSMTAGQGHIFSNHSNIPNRSNFGVNEGQLFWFHNGGLGFQPVGPVIADGKWRLVGLTRDAANNWSLWINETEYPVGNSAAALGTTQTWHIGINSLRNQFPFNGVIDDVRIYNQAVTGSYILKTRTWNPTPADGATGVMTSPVLQWNTAMDPNNLGQVNPQVTAHYLYVTLNEPNFSGISPVTIAVSGAAGTYPSALDKDSKVYWRVDQGIHGSAFDAADTIEGVVWSFETLKSVPVIMQQPVGRFVGAGQDVVFTVEVASLSPVFCTWYKVVDGGDDTVMAGPTLEGFTLTILNAQVADEGLYYCKAVNASGEASAVFSDTAKLAIKRLVGHWPLDGNANDVSGNESHGQLITLTAGTEPNWAGGIDGQAFNGLGTNYIEISNEPLFRFYENLSVSAWVKGTNFGSWNGIVSKHAGIIGWELIKHGNPGVAGFIVRRSTDYLRYETMAGTTSIEDGQWHHLAAVLDGVKRQRRLYVDGLLEASAAYDHTMMQNGSNAPVRIAATMFNDVLGTPAVGVIDDVRLYNYPLDSQMIAQDYADMTGESVCYYGAPAWDISGPNGTPDCVVDLYDFAQLASDWQACGLVPDTYCP